MAEYRATMRPRQQGRTMEEAAGYKRGLLRAAEMAESEQHVLDNRGKEEAATYFYRFAARLRQEAGE